MKRNLIYLAALSALALTACSQDEAVNEIHPAAESAIGFRTNLDRTTVSRSANATTTTNLDNFDVVALNEDNSTYFHKLRVTKNEQGAWTYSPVHYWPKGKGLRFFAAGNAGSNGLSEKANGNFPGFNNYMPHNLGYTYKPGADANTQGEFGGTNNTIKHAHHDLVYAYYESNYDNINVGNSGTNDQQPKAVELNFKHALAQIEVQAKNTNENRKIEIIGVRIKNLKASGSGKFKDVLESYAGTTPEYGIEWTPGSDLSDYFFRFPKGYATPHVLDGKKDENGKDKDPINIAPGNFNFMVIPQKTEAWAQQTGTIDDNGGTYISVACRIYSVSNGENATSSETLIYPKNDSATDVDKLYGMAMVPVGFELEAGKKYTYVLDFSSGSGQVDPEKPTEPEGGDIDTPDEGEGGDEIDGHPIQFTVKVDNWAAGTGGNNGSNLEM